MHRENRIFTDTEAGQSDSPESPVQVETIEGWKIFTSTWSVITLPPLPDILIAEVERTIRSDFVSQPLREDPTANAVRHLFKAAGTDPTKYRPSFEALARRIIKGNDMPRIHPAVDWSNILSLLWHVPCCIADLAVLKLPLKMRVGRPGETMESLRGPINLEGKILIEDANGPYSTPITDSRRAAVGEKTRDVLFEAYFPVESYDEGMIRQTLAGFNLPA